ncbi:sulfotransferase domain-containing protein [Novosphingobium lentum]|uniref:sulfotransferase domain-containing protein n=1 Tax=Novosphingobium lentum TaxID=145287 RepID=UPI000A001725|nr:sulfotransferase domain-containing protein [Novosphingobium lentum]
MRFEPLRKLARRMRRARNDALLARRVPDVSAFLVSYPKSGRTWLRYLLSCYLARIGGLDFEPDLSTTFRVLPNFDIDPVRGLPGCVVMQLGTRIPLIAVSHRRFDARWFTSHPVIFLVRDPRDVCVSAYFHQTRHKQRFDGDMASFIEDAEFGIPSIAAYHNGWAAGLSAKRMLVVSYEEMSRDTHAAVERILRFLDVPIDEAALDYAVARARFDSMKRDELRTGLPGHSYNRDDDESVRMRKGKVGGFDDYLSSQEADRIAELCSSILTPEAVKLFARCDCETAAEREIEPCVSALS